MIGDSTRRALDDVGLDPNAIDRLVAAALAEDLDGGSDVTTAATVAPEHVSCLDLVARRGGVVAGMPIAAAVFDAVSLGSGNPISVVGRVVDGERVSPGQVLMSATGRTRDLLTAERTALNFLGHLSGVATLTRAWADALEGSRARVRDTRKTTPLLRAVEKYAVRCGGGVNHRMSLSDAALVKDNHIIAAGGVTAAFAMVRQQHPDLAIEIEVDSLAQLDEAILAGADLILLDNFDLDQMRRAVAVAAAIEPRRRPLLEASGGLRLSDAAAVGATGIDYVAVGALTHSAPTLDIGGDLRECGEPTR